MWLDRGEGRDGEEDEEEDGEEWGEEGLTEMWPRGLSWEVEPVVEDSEGGGLTVRRWRWEGFWGLRGLLGGGGVVLREGGGVLRVRVKRLLS